MQMDKEEHVMILHIHAGILSSKDSTSLTNQIFTNLAKCQEACNQAKELVKTTTKSYKCICVKK
jgi:hypothetical protein